jgi:protein phosphatase 1 regulatory subunit 11
MAAGQRSGPRGGQTQVQNSAPTRITTAPRQAVLHLRGAVRDGEEAEGEGSNGSTSRRIQWSEDVVDNEGMGKKSSKGTSQPLPVRACERGDADAGVA